ncbi:hypothetical protein An02g09520 [Aspergillus niger]|uniref:Uncharacterized protein n=2 Tax=Aspergillus niger TaxID=5061 RepID=A2QE61_ASPNC|nr:hypothetical protein An02g09520 [Aspergillus niger]CAK37822.1 hypothetical protein An02g09520 [Aspergillus niger]
MLTASVSGIGCRTEITSLKKLDNYFDRRAKGQIFLGRLGNGTVRVQLVRSAPQKQLANYSTIGSL